MFLMKAKSLATQFILSAKQTKTSYLKYKSVLALLPGYNNKNNVINAALLDD